jgi:hypothetical protein
MGRRKEFICLSLFAISRTQVSRAFIIVTPSPSNSYSRDRHAIAHGKPTTESLILTELVNDEYDKALNAQDAELATLNSQNRRRLVHSTLVALTTTATPLASSATPLLVPTPKIDPNLNWPLGKVAFSLLPLAGGVRRATVQETVVHGKIWTHDQIQGIVNVNVPVRQTTIALKGGGLWIHNPVAPTKQHLQRMHELEQHYGPVQHIVLGTVALEHKATFGAFARQFPKATVWIQPGQWAFPVNLPIEVLGVTQRGKRLRELPDPTTITQEPPEWMDEIEYEILGPLKFQSVGAFSETAFFHKDTRTLLVTDTVVSVTKTPPAIIEEDPRAMLFHARDYATQRIEDTPETRERGWRRMVQFGLVFFPSQIDVVPFGQALKEAQQIDPSLRNLGYGAVPFKLYPWTWHDNDADIKNFNAISQGGTLFCPPILTKLILDREPERTLKWVDTVCRRFQFERVIPCHLNNNVKAGPQEFRRAFDVLRGKPGDIQSQRTLPEDLALLQKASDSLTEIGVVGPSLVCDGEPARVVGRFASKPRKQ